MRAFRIEMTEEAQWGPPPQERRFLLAAETIQVATSEAVSKMTGYRVTLIEDLGELVNLPLTTSQ